MGVHKRQREMDEIKEHYIKKSSCILLVLMALLVGAFIGNTITMLYLGNQGSRDRSVQTASAPAPQSQQGQPHMADPVALAALEEATRQNPTSFEAWVNLGNFCFDHNLPEKAIPAYERAVELLPMNSNVWSDLGVMYRRTKQFNKAVDAFAHAADLDKEHVTARFNMGVVYLHDLNQPDEALKAWKQVVAMKPDAKTPNGKLVADLIKGLEKQ